MVPRSTEIPSKLPELENYATTVPENTDFPTGLGENFSIPGQWGEKYPPPLKKNKKKNNTQQQQQMLVFRHLMLEVRVFHDKKHYVLILNYVEKWLKKKSFTGLLKYSTSTHANKHWSGSRK